VSFALTIDGGEVASVPLTYALVTSTTPAKMRGTLTYMLRTGEGTTEEKVDFSLRLPCVAFLVADSISRCALQHEAVE